jgi:putative membrane protein
MRFLQTGAGRAIAALVITYCVGVVGMLLPHYRGAFALLTPVQLLLTLVLMLAYHPGISRRVVAVWALVFSLGFAVEVLGVNTGWPFGRYQYGSVLGLALWRTPLLIGVNWLLLVYASSAVALQALPAAWRNATAVATLVAVFMAALDALIEPVAVALGFWHWYGQPVPVQNYAAWFVCAWVLAALHQWLTKNDTRRSPVAVWVFALQVAFFAILVLFM